jgi:tetratricopeptide (TPR) repeat protein
MTAKAHSSMSTPGDSFAAAMSDIRSGNFVGAQAKLERVIAAQPANAEALHFLGMACAMNGNLDRAEALVKQAISIKADYAEAYCSLGRVLHGLQRLDGAVDCLRTAVRLQPRLVEAHFVMGLVYEDLKDLEGALSSYNQAISLKSDFADAFTNRGVIEAKLNKLTDALASHDRAIALQPGFADAHGNRGDVLQALNRLEEALASYDAAISLRPDLPREHRNRGNVLEKLQRYGEALASYEKAMALGPDSAEIHYERGRVLYEVDRTGEALAEYATALSVDPGHAQAKIGIFSHHFRELRDLALIERLCAETSELSLAQEIARAGARDAIFDFRVVHDLEQSRYLISQGCAHEWLRRAHRRLEDICGRYAGDPVDSAGPRLIRLSNDEAEDVNLFRDALLRYPVTKPVKHCLNPDNDWRAIEEQYFASTPEVVSIDDLLSQEALEELRRFCLGSTLWKIEYKNQYLGAFPTGGFLSSLHLRIALELKERMPRIFGEHRLEQLWAFKYNPRIRKGINAHADFAKVNLNFWVTPDDANLDPASGGLIVYETPCPPSWSLKDYNRNEAAIRALLEKDAARSRKVPYRCNRAVLFNSALFHETDDIRFKEGYENRRINITYLFGRELRMY